jgi:hypothetical protein
MDSHRTPEDRLAKSYIWHGQQCYFVSTINRESSAALAYGARYSETLVFAFDWEKRERTDLLHQADGAESSIHTHLDICKKLHEQGIRGLINEI